MLLPIGSRLGAYEIISLLAEREGRAMGIENAIDLALSDEI